MAVIYDMSHIDAMEGHEFEHFIATLLQKLGYEKVEVTRGSGDQGVDVLAEKEGVRYAVQCKCYSSNLENTPIQEINTGKMIYHCHVGIVVTNRYFTPGAQDAAKATGVLLWDRSKLQELIERVSPEELHERDVRRKTELDEQTQKNFATRLAPLWESLRKIHLIAAGHGHIVGLKSDGTVLAEVIEDYGENEYGECNVSDWRDIIAVSAGCSFTVGLKSNGTVLAVGDNSRGECNVSSWRDIIAISAGDSHTVGLRLDGTTVAVGWNDFGQCCVSNWRSIVAVSAGDAHTVGLKFDGTVVAAGSNKWGQCNVSGWRDIVAISAGEGFTVGLKSDGTVIATIDSRDKDRCNVTDWRDIMVICAGNNDYIVGLKTDGTIINSIEGAIYSRQNIISIDAGECEYVLSDGTISNTTIRSKWKLFDDLETMVYTHRQQQEKWQEQMELAWKQRAEMDEAERKQLEEGCAKEKAILESEKAMLQTEVANLKGLFTGRRRKEIIAKLAEIEQELSRLC